MKQRCLLFFKYALLLLIAFSGSLVFGTVVSFCKTWETPSFSKMAWLFTGAAGLSWAVFIPALYWSTGVSLLKISESCFEGMAWGELILNAGALLMILNNCFNAHLIYVTVGIANLVMMIYLARKFLKQGVSLWKTIGLWMILQNGLFVFWWIMIQKWMEA